MLCAHSNLRLHLASAGIENFENPVVAPRPYKHSIPRHAALELVEDTVVFVKLHELGG